MAGVSMIQPGTLTFTRFLIVCCFVQPVFPHTFDTLVATIHSVVYPIVGKLGDDQRRPVESMPTSFILIPKQCYYETH